MKISPKGFLDAIIFLLMLLFIYAAVFKILDIKNFIGYINVYHPFGRNISGTVALGIPLIELCVAGLLFVPRLRLTGLYASMILMLGFTLYIGYFTFINTTKRPCACGGIMNSMEWKEHLIFNIAFTILAITGIALHIRLNRKKYNASIGY